MQARLPRRWMWIAEAAFYLAFASTAARSLFQMAGSRDFGLLFALLSAYLALLIAETFIVPRFPLSLHLFNLLQVGVTIYLLSEVGEFDFFALLFIPPCGKSILHFPLKTALAWILSITVLMETTLALNFPIGESVGYMIIYPTGIFLFTGLSYLAMQAEYARMRSESLLAELQAANRRLQAYSEQVEELAAASERNRLARELHDSVTQIIFGLTLSAQAARILIDRDPKRAAAELDHLQSLAQNALAEMRALIQQMHPRSIAEEGLPAALRRLAAERLANDGLTVDLRVTGDRRAPAKVEEELYRVAQEALNNIVKHARADRAQITLNMNDGDRMALCIEDDGVGFDPGKARALPGHLGLTSMSERVSALGGSLRIESAPGKGTRVRVELALAPEVEHA